MYISMVSLMRIIIGVWLVLVCCCVPITAEANAELLRCAAGSVPSINACHAPSSATQPLAGHGNCCTCPPMGTFSDDGLSCKRCSNDFSGRSGVNMRKSGPTCYCMDGYGDYDPVSMTCRQCPVNHYSLNSKCVPCAPNSFAAAQSSTCTAIKCPANAYMPDGGFSISDCTRCKVGTTGQSHGSASSCRCKVGFASFDRISGHCQQCKENAIVVPADKSKPNENITVCEECPLGTIANEDRSDCVVSSNGLAQIAVN